MRSRRATFRRPEPPSIDHFVDRLESELRYVMQVDPPSPASRWRRSFYRWTRSMLRPVMHGGMALAMIFIVVSSVSAPQTRIVMDMSQRAPEQTSDEAYWVKVIEVPDPVPVTYPSVAREQASRFVVSVEPAPRQPHIPDGVGLSSV